MKPAGGSLYGAPLSANQDFAQNLIHGSGAAPAPHVAVEATTDLMCAQRFNRSEKDRRNDHH
jgi:hypothetical protein